MEIEFKFQVPAAEVNRVENAMRVGEVLQIELQARYFDTADGTLAAAGIALRLRSENGQWLQTVKARGEGVLDRFEHNVDLASAPEVDALPDILLHKGTVAGRLLKSALGGAALRQTFNTEVSRVVRYEYEGASKAEVALDIGEVRTVDAAGAMLRSSPVCELEIELVVGDAADLVPIARRWIDRHGLFISTLSKSGRGSRLLEDGSQVEAVKADPPRYPREHVATLDGANIQRRVVAACLAQVLPNASEVAVGHDDHDIVHQLRVGIRRLRTALKELDGLAVGNFEPGWEAPLRKVFSALGEQRDRELLVDTIQPTIEAAGGPPLSFKPTPKRKTDVGAAVRATDFQLALCELVGFTMSGARDALGGRGARATPATPAEARKILQKRLRSLHRHVVSGGEIFASLTADERHHVRKRLKQLRYLAEFVGPLFGIKRTARYIEALTPAQDALGTFNDMAVASASYARLAPRNAKAWFAVGWLAALQQERAGDCRRAIQRIGKANKFWTAR